MICRKRNGSLLAVSLAAGAALWPLVMNLTPATAQIGPNAPAKSVMGGNISPEDEKLAAELASRNMDKLLDYFFEKNHFTPEQRNAAKFSIAWRELTTDSFSKLPPSEQKQRITDIVAAIDKNLAMLNDPKQLLNQASALILYGEGRYINTLEYWGENPRTQASLNPIAETVDKILTQAITNANTKATQLLNTIKTSDDPALKQWEAADGMEQLCRYTQGLSRYSLALSIDKANPRRKQICDEAITAMKLYDQDGQTVQIQARLGIAKLNMAKGDYVEADKYFELVKNDPKAPIGDGYQARYFDVISDMMAKKFTEAQSEHEELLAWQKTNLPPDAATQNGAEAASSMLAYRLADAQGKNDLAISTLMDLVTKRPDLKGIIFEQILERLPPNADMTKQDVLLLEAIMTHGEDAARKKATETLTDQDLKDIERAILAGKEIIRRAEAKSVDIASGEERSAAFRIPILQERIGKLGEASDGFINYVLKYPKDANADDALEHGLSIVLNKLRKDPATKDEPETFQRYDRALELGVSHGYPQLAYSLGLRYKDKKDWPQAAAAFAKVPANGNPTQVAMAHYYQMFCDNELITSKDSKISPTERAVAQDQIQTLADQIDKAIDAASATAKDAQARIQLQRVRVLTILTATSNARANKDFKRAVELLANFETQVKGLPDPETYLSEALYDRFVAQSALGQNDAALGTLQQLIGSSQDPKAAVDMIANFLAKLDDEYTTAREAKNMETALSLGAQRAQLSELLIKQLEKDPKNPNRVDFLKFNARAQRQAAELEKDPTRKNQYLAQSMDTYQSLLKDSPDDAGLKFEIALIRFDMAEVDPKLYADAQKALLEIVGQLGKPELVVIDKGTQEEKREPNKAYWQGRYELLRSSVEVAKQDASRADLMDQAKDGLQNLLILYPDPPLYKDEYTKLRNEILPGWDPNAVPTTGPSTKPAVAGK